MTVQKLAGGDKVMQMLLLQADVNAVVDGVNWWQKERPWYRAVWMEAGEMLDSYGYKWWKAHERKLEDVHMELVDIWHFAMSNWIEEQFIIDRDTKANFTLEQMFIGDNTNGIAKQLDNAPQIQQEFPELLEAFVDNTLRYHRVDITYLAPLFHSVGLNVDQLYKMYIGKNALNRFRQDNGYKEGRYHKEWFGVEDNEHLIEILDRLDGAAFDFYNTLMGELYNIYNQHLSNWE